MINKSRFCLYLFDFDGTLVGQNHWSGYWKNTISAFKDGPYINPHEYDIRWSILTARPRIDIPVIKTVCAFHGLRPKYVITSPMLRWDASKTIEDYLDMKVQIISNIVQGNDARFPEIEKVYYIDNDLDVVSYMNSKRRIANGDQYQIMPFISFTTIDFVKGTYDLFM